jgi:hypothetical protein
MKDGKLGSSTAIVIGAIAAACYMAGAPASAEVSAAELKNLYGAELHVLGAVENIDLAKGVLLVAGQHVSIGHETSFSYNGIPVEDQLSALHMIEPGDLVAVFGPLNTPAVSVSRLKESYVAGATTLFVKGKVSSTQESLGRARIDALGVDITPAMADAKFTRVEPGQVIEAVGIQPTAGGLLLAESVASSSIVGTSTGSIVGTSNRSIVGTSNGSIVGTSSGSIVGTSNRSIVGTSNGSIVGTSSGSIVGTSNGSIVGTSNGSIVGTSSGSIVGTSNRSIVGTSNGSIVGTSSGSIVGTSAGSIVGTS